MRQLIVVALLAAPLAGAGQTERPVSGVITAIDEDDRTIWVGPVAFYVPRDVYEPSRRSGVIPAGMTPLAEENPPSRYSPTASPLQYHRRNGA